MFFAGHRGSHSASLTKKPIESYRLLEVYGKLIFTISRTVSSELWGIMTKSAKFMALALALLWVALPAAAANMPQHDVNADSLENAAPPPKTPEEASYTIIAGDVLQITVWKEDGLDRETLVLPDGTINFPLVGSMVAAGKNPGAVQDELQDT